MANGERSAYLGTELPDGTLRIEKPEDEIEARKRMLEILDTEKLPVTSTQAENLGTAALKIAISALNREKTRPK
jgi:hypothetical protein